MKTEYLGSARYTMEKVLVQATAFSGIKMEINGKSKEVEKTYKFSFGYFDVYLIDERYPSYLMTKGIPFLTPPKVL